MAVSIKELIERREEIAANKKTLYDLETSIGTITIKQPSRMLVSEAQDLETGADEYLILNTVVEPNLKDKSLQQTFECTVPTDIVERLFMAGEIGMIATKIIQCAGYRKDIKAEIHEAAKN